MSFDYELHNCTALTGYLGSGNEKTEEFSIIGIPHVGKLVYMSIFLPKFIHINFELHITNFCKIVG